MLRFLVLCLLLAIGCHALQPDTAPSRLVTSSSRAPSRLNILHRFNVSNAAWQLSTAVDMDVTPKQLQVSGSSSWFTVKWSGVPDPDFDDLIALYVPADADITKTAPVKFKFCAQASQEHVTTGAGVARFKLINYRQDMAFILMKGGFLNPTALAKSSTIHVLNPNEPLQGRLARTRLATEMLVQWTTHNSSAPTVRWGPLRGEGRELPFATPATSASYAREDMCGGVARSSGWLDPGLQHRALLTGLEPGRRYSYSFGDDAWGFSARFAFAAPPLPQHTVHVLVAADIGQAELDGSNQLLGTMLPSLNTTARLAADAADYSLLLHNGDLSYAEGFGGTWENFFHQMAPIASYLPYMVTVGNHEQDWPGSPGDRWGVQDSGGECGVPYERRLHMPDAGPNQPWYSFDHGPVHFLQYSTEHSLDPGSPQLAFLLGDLQAVNRSVTPWLVVSGHRPLYISSTNEDEPDGDQVVARQLRASLEGLLLQYHVDLTLSGHHHTYQRTCPVFEQVCVGYAPGGHARGPVHVVTGNGGAPLSLNVQQPPPAFLVTSQPWWGYLRLHASRTRLAAEAVSDLDGSLMDRFELRKHGAWGDEVMAQRHQASS